MPEIGRPENPGSSQYRQVTMGAREPQTGAMSDAKLKEKIINQAQGRRADSIYKEGPHNQMGKDEFLKLLTYQLQNQDPMNPVDQSKMTGELAQFSQLEQLSNLNTKFDNANKNKMIQDKFYAASFIGKKVVTAGTSLKLNEHGDSANVLFKLAGLADKVVIRIQDEKKQTVGEIWRENMVGGPQQIVWDGTTTDGQPAAKGNYQVIVKAWDKTGMEVPAQTQATGHVTSVNFEEGEPVLTVDGQKVYLRDVESFHEAGAEMGKNIPSGAPSHNQLPSIQNKPVPVGRALQSYHEQNEGIYD